MTSPPARRICCTSRKDRPCHEASRGRLTADLTSFLAQLKADTVAPLPFSELHAAIWSALIHDPSIAGVAQTDRQVYATALYEGLTVVEEARPETAQLQGLGIEIHVL